MVRKSHMITGEAPGTPIALHRTGTGKIAIGGVEVNFYILDDGSRVADLSAAEASLGFSTDVLASIPGVLEIVPSAVHSMTRTNMLFREREDTEPRPCVLADVLIHLCSATLAVRRTGNLQPDKRMYATLAELLLADVAIRASRLFVDAITGSVLPSQDNLGENVLTTVTQPYMKTFPTEFYDELYRLRGLGAVEHYGRHPGYIGTLTSNIVYKRFAPGAIEALKDNSPRDSKSGRHKRKLFQMLAPEQQIKLQDEYLPTVIDLMRSSETFDEFIGKLDERFPLHRRVVRPKRR